VVSHPPGVVLKGRQRTCQLSLLLRVPAVYITASHSSCSACNCQPGRTPHRGTVDPKKTTKKKPPPSGSTSSTTSTSSATPPTYDFQQRHSCRCRPFLRRSTSRGSPGRFTVLGPSDVPVVQADPPPPHGFSGAVRLMEPETAPRRRGVCPARRCANLSQFLPSLVSLGHTPAQLPLRRPVQGNTPTAATRWSRMVEPAGSTPGSRRGFAAPSIDAACAVSQMPHRSTRARGCLDNWNTKPHSSLLRTQNGVSEYWGHDLPLNQSHGHARWSKAARLYVNGLEGIEHLSAPSDNGVHHRPPRLPFFNLRT